MTDRFYSELPPSACYQQLCEMLNRESGQIRAQVDTEQLDSKAVYSLLLRRIVNGHSTSATYRCKIKAYGSGSLIEGYFHVTLMPKLYLAFLYSLACFPLILALLTTLSGNGFEGLPYCFSLSLLMGVVITLIAVFNWMRGRRKGEYIREILSEVFPAKLRRMY